MSAASTAAATRGRRRIPSGLYLVAALIVTACLWGFLAPGGHAANSDGGDTAVAAGKALFAEGCASCHGLAGEGIQTGNEATRAPSLIGVGAAAVDFQVSTGRMPLEEIGVQAARHQTRYTQAEINEMGAYVESLGGGPLQPTFSAADVNAANLGVGGEIFRANCASCHNYSGAGNVLDDGRYAPELGRATSRQIYEAMLTGPESMPVFGDQQITPQQKVDVVKYVEGLRKGEDPGGANLGHLGPVPEGLVIFVVGIGALVVVALWIGSRNRQS